VTKPGRYSIQLIVNDGRTDSEPAKWNIDVAPSPEMVKLPDSEVPPRTIPKTTVDE